ncbi:MAG: hypothetical protein KA781_03835 [Aquabacterium sp.]|nr:hypothetical protein [Aquabacterium sp.]
MSILQAIEADRKPAKREVPPDTQQACIDLPGEAVRCVVHKPKLEVMLRKHRDVIFDVNLRSDLQYTVEAEDSDFYNARDKQIVLHKKRQRVSFRDGERLHVWVSREFKGRLILKAGSQTLGTYAPVALDPTRYPADPSVKPEPLVIALGATARAHGMCTPSDPFDTDTLRTTHGVIIAPWVKDLPSLGSQFEYTHALASLPSERAEIQEYAVVAVAEANELQPQVRSQLDNGTAIVDYPEKIFTPLTIDSVLAKASVSFLSTLGEGALKESLGYAQEHWKQFSRFKMTVRVERKAKGKYVVVFTGKALTKAKSTAVKQFAGYAFERKTFRPPMGTPATAPLDGGYGRTGKAGFGGVKRITLTTASNFKSGLKIQVIGTIVDLYGDYSTVFGSDGSKDLSEFLGRAGVSLFKAGTTAAIGGALAAVFGGILLTAGAPVLLVAGVVVLGYIAAATVLDLVDSSFEIKERVAVATR